MLGISPDVQQFVTLTCLKVLVGIFAVTELHHIDFIVIKKFSHPSYSISAVGVIVKREIYSVERIKPGSRITTITNCRRSTVNRHNRRSKNLEKRKRIEFSLGDRHTFV